MDDALAGADATVELEIETPRPPADAARAACRRRRLARRRADRLGVDAGDVLGTRRACGAVRPSPRPGARDLGVHRRGFRLEAGRWRRGAPRRRARAADGSPGQGRQRSGTRSSSTAAPRLDASECPPRRQSCRPPCRRRRRRARGAGARRLGALGPRTGHDSLSQRSRAGPDVPAAPQPADAERLPSARLRRGNRRAGAGGRRARASARARPARAAPPQSRRRRSASGLPYSSNHILACYDRAAELAGWADREGSRAARRRAAARDGLREPDLVGRWRAARARDRASRLGGARARRDRDPGHRHRHADDRKAGRCGGARSAGRARPRRRRRHRPERLRADSPVAR